MSDSAVRQIYLGCALPIMEYGLQVWYGKCNETFTKKFQCFQNRTLRRIQGAVGSTAISVMHAEAGVMPLKERFRFLASVGSGLIIKSARRTHLP